ncbi:hypothetical protein NXY07_04750 [Phocaeicola dorei]|nr:hypothetical protein [Phocaeicola dorei]
MGIEKIDAVIIHLPGHPVGQAVRLTDFSSLIIPAFVTILPLVKRILARRPRTISIREKYSLSSGRKESSVPVERMRWI